MSEKRKSKILKRINIALLSFAHSHQYLWAESILENPYARIYGIWDDNRERGEEAAARFGTIFFDDLDQLLLQEELDAVAICSETSKHAELTIASAQAGKHILCEKPMATSLEDCQRMMDSVKEAGVFYMQSFPQRFIPGNIEIKRLLEEGAIGKIGMVRKRHGHGFGLGTLKEEMPWIIDPALAGGGAYLDEGIHGADLLRFFFGDPLSVVAKIDTLHMRLNVDDNGVAIYTFANDILAVHCASWTWLAAGPTTEIYGDKGTIIQSFTDFSSNAVPWRGEVHLRVFCDAEREKGWQDMGFSFDFKKVKHQIPTEFIKALRKGIEPPITGEDGMKALEMILGAYLSSKEGKIVQFPLKA